MNSESFSGSGIGGGFRSVCAFGKKVVVLAVVTFLMISHRGAWALQSRQLSLSEMASQSGRIVVGRVLSAVETSMPAPGGGSIPITQYTLSVSETVKGQHTKTLVIKHVRLGNKIFIVGGGEGPATKSDFPAYKANEDVVLFLTSESKLGLSSPVGLTQGVFRIAKDSEDKPVSLVNGVGNAGLLEGTSSANAQAQNGGPASYAGFISEVKAIVKAQKGQK